MSDVILITFYLVFLSQIFLLSFYYPRKILKRMLYVIVTYPPSKYPKLYPNLYSKFSGTDADEAAKKGPRYYRNANLFTLLLGFILLGMAIQSGFSLRDEGGEVFLALYFFLQMLPLAVMEISELNQFKLMKLMRKENLDTTRKADLHPRRFFDFISPVTFSVAVFLLLAYILFGLYINDFEVSWGSDMFIMLTTVTLAHLFYAGIIMWHLYGKKINPYQANKDRVSHMKITVKTLVYSSIMMSIFFMAIAAMEEFNLHYLQALLMSVFFQVIAVFGIGTMLRTSKIESIDFDVYKEDVPI